MYKIEGFPDVSALKNLPAMQETWVRSLGGENPLEEETETHSSILAWRIPWTEELDRLWSMGSQRVRHNWATNTSLSLYWLLPYLSASLLTKLEDIHCQCMLSPICLFPFSLESPLIIFSLFLSWCPVRSMLLTLIVKPAFPQLIFLCSPKHFLPLASKTALTLTATLSHWLACLLC